MNDQNAWNMNIICVDAEEDTLKLYKKVLAGFSNQIAASLSQRSNTRQILDSDNLNCAVYPAMSGKAAIRTALEAKTKNTDIAVGFFDISVQGEMDGANTIKEIKRIFPSLLCAIVTEETSAEVSPIRALFESQDEWLFIKKPFSEEELQQTACNLIVSWNLRRDQISSMLKLEKTNNGVQEILRVTPKLFNIQTYDELYHNAVAAACQLANSQHVFLAMKMQDGRMQFKQGSGKFDVKTDEEREEVMNILTNPAKWEDGCPVTIALSNRPVGILFIDDLPVGDRSTEMLEVFAQQIASAFENLRIQEEKEKQKVREQELIIATKIQRSLLPKEKPESADIDLYGLMQSAKEIGGDYFDYFYREIPPDKQTEDIFVSIGDVAGKGVPAGLIMSEVRSFIHALNPFYSSTREIMDRLARFLEKDMKNTGRFMSLLLMLWDSKNRYFKFTSAGHEHIIHYVAKEGKCKVFKAGGVVLGLKHSLVSAHLKEQKLTIAPNDVIVLFTDGTTEAIRNDDANDMYGLDRMVELTVEYSKLPIDKILNNIFEDILKFIDEGEQSDDITLVGIKGK